MGYLRIGCFGITMRVACILAIILLLPLATASEQPEYDIEDLCEIVDSLQFDGNAANLSVQAQVDLGPRLPGSQASADLRARFANEIGQQWTIKEDPHHRGGLNLTNLIATWIPPLVETEQFVVLAAHYDSRDRAERDPDENRTMEPIPGANDAASGVAILEELGRLIPQMGLKHEVRILLTDAEDQGETPSMLGAKAWAENITLEDKENMSAFILLDMVGDSDLTLTQTWPGSQELWKTITPLASALGMVDSQKDCSGGFGDGTFDPTTNEGVIDDHVPVHQRGIPAIDIIDLRYGEGAELFGGYWHTHEDTPDKVSAESLGKVGRLVELGLRNQSWVQLPENENEEDEENNIDNTIITVESRARSVSVMRELHTNP